MKHGKTKSGAASSAATSGSAGSAGKADTAGKAGKAAAQRREGAERRRSAGAMTTVSHLVIEQVTPEVDGGRHAAKRVVGDVCEVGAAIFKDGHDLLAARLRFRGPDEGAWQTSPLIYRFEADRWVGGFPVDRIGRWSFTIEAWTDRWGTWRSGLEKKMNAGQDVHLELEEGALLLDGTARRLRFGEQRTRLQQAAARLRDSDGDMNARGQFALAPELALLMAEHYIPDDLTSYRHELPLQVDRPAAAFASWYEFFPRSTGPQGGHGTFRDAQEMLPRIAELGYDVVYLPPIHPIGHTFRKGRNNSLTPTSSDVGSPWAIGNEDGGHTAVAPELGTVEDFEAFVRRAAELGLEVALDYALQCSPDHPWVHEHPDWFVQRPDGSIQYAENPPKKYQDIYPLNFWTDDREALWNACRDILLFWIARGVKTFRVDNPHTKPFAFWEWAIREVQREHPDTVFLAEAFTRPSKLLNLAKIGFTQSYTYFTWKNTATELREFLAEFSRPDVLEYYRGNFFANTPDILHEYLQQGGLPAFRIRMLLAGTLSPLYGIYSGYEFGENAPARAGSEEYLDSEKYQVRHRDYGAKGTLDPELATLNRVRREQPALQRTDNLRFLPSDNDRVLAYMKGRNGTRGAARGDDLIVAVTLDPAAPQETVVHVPIDAIGLAPDQEFQVEDLLTGVRYTWRGSRNYVRLDPHGQPAHVLRVVRGG